MSKFLDIEYTKNGDYLSLELDDGKATRRKVEWKVHRSVEPKVCAFSGVTINKDDKMGVVSMKKKGFKPVYFHPDFNGGKGVEDKVVEENKALTELNSMLTFLDIYVEDKQNKIIKKENSLKREVSEVKRKKELIGTMRSKLHTLITTVRTLEDI